MPSRRAFWEIPRVSGDGIGRYGLPISSITVVVTQTVDTTGGKDAIKCYASISTQNGTPLQNLTPGNITLKETISGATTEVVVDEVKTSSQAAGANSSIILVLDGSGSMDDASADLGAQRLSASKIGTVKLRCPFVDSVFKGQSQAWHRFWTKQKG